MNKKLDRPAKFLSAKQVLPLVALLSCQSAFGFVATEQKVSNNSIAIIDNEYDQIHYKTTWQANGILSVMDLDPTNGDFLLPTKLDLDTQLADIPGILQGTGTGNGPEWIWSDTGSQILYTKALGPSQVDYQVYRAVQTESGWTTGPLPDASSVAFGVHGFAPTGTFAAIGQTPRVSEVYRVPNSNLVAYGWRNLETSESAAISPPASPTNSGRWQLGDNDTFVYLQVRKGIPQIFLYNVSTNISKQITTDAPVKKDPFIFNAPEYGGKRIIITVLDEINVGVYLEDASGNWSLVNTLHPPTKLRHFHSAEPTIYNGQTYVELAAENKDNSPSEIWLLGIRPDVPFYREVSDHNVQLVRNDPEFLSTSGSGLIIYFTKHGAGTIYRCQTGLGVPVENVITATAGDDVVTGTSLSDRISGGMGSDTLTGGFGNDQFVVDTPTEGVDTINDFEVGHDQIDLHLILATFGYAGNAPLTDGYVRVQASDLPTDCVIRVDGDGNGTNKSGTKILLIKNVAPSQMNNPVNFIF